MDIAHSRGCQTQSCCWFFFFFPLDNIKHEALKFCILFPIH